MKDDWSNRDLIAYGMALTAFTIIAVGTGLVFIVTRSPWAFVMILPIIGGLRVRNLDSKTDKES